MTLATTPAIDSDSSAAKNARGSFGSTPKGERGANGDFAHAGTRARKKQVGDVGARNQQHEAHGSEEHEHPGPDAGADQMI